MHCQRISMPPKPSPKSVQKATSSQNSLQTFSHSGITHSKTGLLLAGCTTCSPFAASSTRWQSENYRVLYEGIEVSSIGIQQGIGTTTIWTWGIDTMFPANEFPNSSGRTSNRGDAQRQFKAAWDRLTADPDKFAYFIMMLRKRL
jgi:hypothetical protein